MDCEQTGNCKAICQASATARRKPLAKKALARFWCKLENAIQQDYLLGGTEAAKVTPSPKEISLWGVPLLPSGGHEGTDIVLLKFLRSAKYRVPKAFEMLQETLQWRRKCRIDEIREGSYGCDMEKFMRIDSTDREGRPLWYNVYGASMKDGEMYRKYFGTKEKRAEFLRGMVQCMEKGIGKLSFKDGGVDSLVHVADLTNMENPQMRELRNVFRTSLMICQNHYPEIIHRHIMINVPFWFYMFHKLLSRFSHHPGKSKFVLARPSRVTQTLLKFINPEDLPAQYGGLKQECDDEFSQQDKASELNVKGKSTERIRIPFTKAGETLVWDLTVVGWDVSYKEEFIPEDECSYRILLHQVKRLRESVRNSFYIHEPGEFVITITNHAFKKKRILFRTKLKPTIPTYILLK